jgi:hypothetical protein
MVREQRKTERIQPFVAPCRIVAGPRAFSAYLTDLSAAGARVHCEAEPPAVGTAVVLEIRITRRPPRSRITGHVEWVKPAERASLFGLSFANVAADQQRALDGLVADFRRRATEIAS